MLEEKKRLEERGVRATQQRLAVYNYLATHKNHPTVETIYSSLHPQMPTLSKTTLYNTLKLFTEKNLVLSLKIDSEEVRYDGDTSDHGHCKCRVCGEVFDFELSGNAPGTLPAGFTAESTHVYVWGTCADCSEK
ncbi:MAG: Fur family transcriptional regulator [Spirochaetales bacterium]|nr:Fur family transcriptional regulator [Spirochaetales bacterium]